MALFKTFKGLSSTLMSGKPNAVEGYAYFTTDDGKFYIDIATADTAVIGTNRIPLSADFADRIPYAICTQNSLINNKTVTTTDPFILKNGSLIIVKFSTPTGDSPGGTTQQNNQITLNVNNTGAIPLYYRSDRIPNEYISQNKIYLFRVNTYQNAQTGNNEFRYDLVGDVIPELGRNETVITDGDGMITSRPLSDSYQIVTGLPTTGIDNNKVYLVPAGSASGGGNSDASGLTYGLSKSGNTITLTASNGTTSSVTDVGLSQSDTQALIDSTITTALSTQYPRP